MRSSQDLVLPGLLLAGLAFADAGNAHPRGPFRPNGDSRPNFVFIMTDDQDLHLNSMAYMPNVIQSIAYEGTTFNSHYCTVSLCCPSRVSLLTGKLAHNTNVTDIVPPYGEIFMKLVSTPLTVTGGYPKFIQQGFNNNYLPVWLQQAGYNTYYTGKLMNAHSTQNWNNPLPGGWNGTACKC
jgi:N-acetylglucosamine-6-sulfatase